MTSDERRRNKDQGPGDGDREAEIARLHEKLAFYESFDRVIGENVSRSGDLLRQAMDLRASAKNELAGVEEAAERRRDEELARQRALLSALLDDVIQLQGQAERLARRVADALDEVESELPTGDFGGPLSSATTDDGGMPPDVAPFDPDATQAPADAEKMRSRLTVIAHGLADAAAAKALREHVSHLEQVASVEPREYAEGVLRLEVMATGSLMVDDLRDWTGGGSFESITEREDLIEIRLAAAAEAVEGTTDEGEGRQHGDGDARDSSLRSE